MKKESLDNQAPYSLFQGKDGKWGVKDKNGTVVYPATYIREAREDGDYTFFDGVSEVCCFSSEDGFSLLSWIDPDYLELLSDDSEESD